MTPLFLLLAWITRVYVLLLVFRIVVEMIQGFSRNWRPQRWFSILCEPIFAITDPPLKLLRKVIPPIRMGNVGLDVSVLVLFFALSILSNVFLQMA